MTTVTCLAKIEEYQKIKNQIDGLSGYIFDCTNIINTTNGYAQEIVINKKPIDKGNLTIISDKIKTIPETLEPIINECNKKIEYYKDMYNKLLIEETKARSRIKNTGGNNYE